MSYNITRFQHTLEVKANNRTKQVGGWNNRGLFRPCPIELAINSFVKHKIFIPHELNGML
jgi:hypothetical protein